MASFSAGTTFTDGVANDVTAAKLAALVNAATPTSGFIQDRTAESTIAADDTLLFADTSDQSNLKRMTVANFAGTLPTATITTLNSTTGTIATLNSTTGTIATLNSTTPTFLGAITASTNTINVGSGQIFKDATGNVGVGTASPAGKLHVNGQTYIQGTASGGLANSTLIANSSGQAQIWGLGSDASTTGSMTFIVARSDLSFSNQAITIDSSGNVGVGTASPASKLHVVGASGLTLSGIDSAVRIARLDSAIDGANGARFLINVANDSGTLTERLRVDSGGNFGIGNTSPSSYNASGDNLVVGNTGDNGITIVSGADGKGYIFFADGVSGTNAYAGQVDFDHSVNALKFGVLGTERLRIDSSGNVGIGVTPSAWGGAYKALQLGGSTSIWGDSSAGLRTFYATNLYFDGTNRKYIANGAASEYLQSTDGAHTFSNATSGTSGNNVTLTERLRIDSSGNLLVGATSGQSSERLLAQNDSATNPSFIAYSPSATFTGYVTRIFADRNTSDSTYNFLSCTRVATAGDVFIIRDSGNAVNTNNSYGAISDIKLKENIENASSQWDDIKSIQVRKFSFKNDEEHKRMLGLVAQEVELISPNLVETVIDRDKDGSDLGTTTKEVKYSVLYMKAVKALQEAMVRIEALESKVTALEAA